MSGVRTVVLLGLQENAAEYFGEFVDVHVILVAVLDDRG
jgi:hypothetical protein